MTQNQQENEQPEHSEVTENAALLKRIEGVQANALNAAQGNCMSIELTYQQAFSIVLRSKQLKQEGLMHPNTISDREWYRQVGICYRQQYR